MTADDTIIVDYRADTLGVISALLAGYSGGITIVREMAQNTDDVPGDDPRWLEFHFEPNALIVRNNTRFRDVDFENIKNIARGGKRLENRSTIGAFGVGFVSVYQLTDTPILRSSGRELQFFPRTGQAHERVCNVVEHTEFELPYRREATEVGSRLGMPVVTEVWVRDILSRLPHEAFRLLFFLRRLSRVAVYDRGQLLIDVQRTITPPSQAGAPEHIEIQQTDRTGQVSRINWLRYAATVRAAAPRRPDGKAAKDSLVQIIMPDLDVPDALAQEHMSGRLYNYLPTDIETGLPFHINGDFYPSTDRKRIDNDHPNHRDWNTWVLRTVGECLAVALPSLLERFADEPLRLYQRLPIKPATPLVQPITERFFEAARGLPIFRAFGGWRTADATRWVARELRPVADEVDLRLMPQPLQTAAWELLSKSGVKQYTLTDHLTRLKADLDPGKPLTDGPPYLRTTEQLERLYHVFEHDIAREVEVQIAQTPVFVDHQGRLWPAHACVQSTDGTLIEGLAESGLRFWSGDPRRFRYTAALVPLFSLTALWETLRREIPLEMELRSAPEWLNTTAKVYRLYRTILRTKEDIVAAAVAHTPLCLSRDGRLCFPETVRMPDGEPILYEILREDPEAPLVARDIYDTRELRSLYEGLGVRRFGWDALLVRLGGFAAGEIALAGAHPCLNAREKLVRIYRYLLDRRDEIRAHPHTVHQLRQLPIWLCQDGVLRSGVDRSLPPDSTDLPGCIRVNQVLDIESGDRLGPLFDMLGIRPLDTERFIRQYLLPQIVGLSPRDHLEALKYLRSQIELISNNGELRQTIKDAVRIRADDDRLYPLASLCYPREQNRGVFGDRLRAPHAIYFGQSAPPSEPQNWVWYQLFTRLGFHIYAPPLSVLDRIVELTRNRRPIETRDRIEDVFRYLEAQWSAYTATPVVEQLRTMRWLPAEGDSDSWYTPPELYMPTHKRLVDQVATVLGFRDSQLPQQGIHTELRFPSVDTRVVVRQLIKLSERGVAAPDQIYQFLSASTVSRDDLRPLQGLAVIYDRTQRRYWKAEHIFLTDQQAIFGSYRGYGGSSPYRVLFETLGARSVPRLEDYRDLVIEIAARYRATVLPSDDMKRAILAYARLADAPEAVIEPLKHQATVVSKAGDGEYLLRLPVAVVFQPPEEIAQALPALPIAQYNLPGEQPHHAEQLLKRIGVRPIEAPGVLSVEFELTPTTDNPANIISNLAPLGQAIRRLLYHHNAIDREAAVHQHLKQLRGYYQRSIQVRYSVKLAGEKLTSPSRQRDVHRDHERPHIYYLRERMGERELVWVLARIFADVLDIRGISHALLRTLIDSPGETQRILDEEQVRQLPPELVLPDEPIVKDPGIQPGVETGEAITIEPPRGGARREGLPGPLHPAQPKPKAEHSNGAASGQLPVAANEQPPRQAPTAVGNNGTTGANRLPEVHHPMENNGTGQTPLNTDRRPRTKPDDRPRPSRLRPEPGESGRATPPRDQSSTAGASGVTHVDGQLPNTNRRPLAPPAVHVRPAHDTAPLLPADAPVFAAPAVMSSPHVPTDMDALRRRAEAWAQERDEPVEAEGPPQRPQVWKRPATQRAESDERKATAARFVLSFAEWHHGFLRLSGAARALFPSLPSQITCVIDEQRRFPLWIDWRRRVPIAYNDPQRAALADYFLIEEIPAGGIVYLEHLHGSEYRLFYRPDEHVVRAVRLATNNQGQVRYEIIDEVTVRCETVDAIYRAEKRHEDQGALWLEAVGKKSVVETLCDLFMASDQRWIHEDDLAAMVLLSAERMVAATTVRQTLRNKLFFETAGDGFWRLNPMALIAPVRGEVVASWLRASRALVAADDEELVVGREALQPALRDIRERLRNVEAQHVPDALPGDIATLVGQAKADPYNDLVAHALVQTIEQRLEAASLATAPDPIVAFVLSSADEPVWAFMLRPALERKLKALERSGSYQLRAAIARLWASYDAGHGQDLRQLENESEVWQLIDVPEPSVSDVLDALALAPSMMAAREKLHLAVQLELNAHPATHWVAEAKGSAAADAFLAHARQCVQARSLLARAHQPAFDETVQLRAHELFGLLDDEGKVVLGLQLKRVVPEARLKAADTAYLVGVVGRVRRASALQGLLLGLAVWELSDAIDHLQHELAGHLAQCHIDLRIWERANNRPWRRLVTPQMNQALRAGWEHHAASYVARLRDLRSQLEQPSETWLDQILDAQRRAYISDLDHEIRKVLA